ncbi:MAG TPA: class I SAM-dependent methyltransferase [Candidatus Binatia bacterium]
MKTLPAGSLVMDGPCGTGRFQGLFLSAGLKTLGADISGQMIQVAKKRTERWPGMANFSRMDFVRIPLRDGAVNAVFSIRFLVHFGSDERVAMLREFCRVARCKVVVSLSLSNPWMRIRRKIKELLRHDKPVRYPVTDREIEDELKQAGLREVQRLWTVPFLSEQILIVCVPIEKK